MAAEPARRRFGSLRARTTLAATIVVGIALIAASLSMLWTLRRSLIRDVDQTMRTQAASLALLARNDQLPQTLALPGAEAALAQVVDDDRRVVAATANLAGTPAMARFHPPHGDSSARTLGDLPFAEAGADYRVVALATPSPTGNRIIYVATSLETIENSVEQTAAMLASGGPLLLALVALLTWRVTGRTLGPVEAIRTEAADISARDLHRRLPEPAADDEIGRLARTMNAMLERLEQGAEHERRFAADASHELQSPLTAIRAELEVSLAHPETTNWQTSATCALEELDRMERLVHDLLDLSRGEAGALPPPESVNLHDIVLLEAAKLRDRERVAVDTTAVSPAQVIGRAADLARLLRNLLDNAERHARSTVRIELNKAEPEVQLMVCDDGPGIPPTERERVFERFARLDDARTRDAGGYGLGLPIAKHIVATHGGTIRITDTDGGGTCVGVTLPDPTVPA